MDDTKHDDQPRNTADDVDDDDENDNNEGERTSSPVSPAVVAATSLSQTSRGSFRTPANAGVDLELIDLENQQQQQQQHDHDQEDSVLAALRRGEDVVASMTPENLQPVIRKMQQEGWAVQPASLSFRNVYYRSPEGAVLVNGVSGYVPKGTFLGVLGQGVSSFFEVMCGRAPKDGFQSGEILLDGLPPDASYERLVGLVTKFDLHLPTLTVRETLVFASLCRSPADMPIDVTKLRVELVMKFLGLSHCADTIVGDEKLRGISGGERRRLSIGVEIVGGHAIMFADLPTNGLDSSTALSIASVARNVSAQVGYSHVWNVAQPSPQLLAMFDRIILLSRGSTIYHGRPQDVEDYFKARDFIRPGHKSVPDFLDELCKTPHKFFHARLPKQIGNSNDDDDDDGDDDGGIGGGIGGGDGRSVESSLTYTHRDAWSQLVRAFKASPEFADLGSVLWREYAPQYDLKFQRQQGDDGDDNYSGTRFVTAWCRQLGLVIIRQTTLTVRNKPVFLGGIVRALLISLVIGSVFGPNLGTSQEDAYARIGLMFFAFTFQAMNSVQLIPMYMDLRTVYYEQLKARFFHASSYYVGTQLSAIPFTVLEVFLFSIIMYSFVGLTGGVPSWSYFYFFLVSLTVNLTSKAFTTMTTALSPSATVAQAVTPSLLTMFLLFAGFMVPFNNIAEGWQWLYYISFGSYALKGLALNEYHGLQFCTTPGKNDCVLSTGRAALQLYDMDEADENKKWTYLYIVVIFYFVFNVIALLAMRFIDWTRPSESIVTPQDAAKEQRKGADFAEYFLSPAATALPAVTEDERTQTCVFDDLTYEVDDTGSSSASSSSSSSSSAAAAAAGRKVLLNKVFGVIEPGKLVALMGASGAGKSTLLDVLAGKKTGGYVSGRLEYNGYERNKYFGRACGYVEQVDSHDPNTTVREAVEFSARLRLPPATSESDIQMRVDMALEDVGLTSIAHERIGDVATGGIAPENRKKCTIAVEIVAAPGILFLDEPTTGLQSDAAVEVMNVVRRMAKRIPCVCTIHQPSAEIIAKFDQLLLLQAGGRVAYLGSLNGVAEYMHHVGLGEMRAGENVADFALNCIHTAHEKRLNAADVFLESKEGQAARESIQSSVGITVGKPLEEVYDSTTAANPLRQFQLLVGRFWSSSLRDRPSLMARLGTSVSMGFVVGTLFWQMSLSFQGSQIRISLAFLTTIFTFFVAQPVMIQVVKARPVYFREHTSNMYNPSAYYMARAVADIPWVLLQGTLFATIVYWAAGLTDADSGLHYWYFLAMQLVMSFMGYAFAELCATLAPDAEVANVINVLVLIMQMQFCGFLIRKDGIPAYWIWLYYFNMFRYPLSFFAANEIADLKFDCPPPLPPLCDNHDLRSGKVLLDRFSISKGDMGLYFGVSVAFLVGLRLLGLLAHYKINHIKR